jgi:hypothetical protein
VSGTESKSQRPATAGSLQKEKARSMVAVMQLWLASLSSVAKIVPLDSGLTGRTAAQLATDSSDGLVKFSAIVLMEVPNVMVLLLRARGVILVRTTHYHRLTVKAVFQLTAFRPLSLSGATVLQPAVPDTSLEIER